MLYKFNEIKNVFFFFFFFNNIKDNDSADESFE